MHDWKKEVKKYIILIPLYNDWKSVSKLLAEIDTIVNNLNAEVSVIIVNDASTEEKSGLNLKYKKIKSVKILNMKKIESIKDVLLQDLSLSVKKKILTEL